jgi:hypothetical protein
LTLSKAFLGSIMRIIRFLYILYYVYGFTYVDPSLHPWNETNLIMGYDLFDKLLNSVCQYFVENLCMCIHQRYLSIILFPACVFVGFWNECNGFIE